jgi:tRNA pseudouridine55 synthase
VPHVDTRDGLLLVDKPRGVTSHDVVDVVRRALGTRKVGHAGTLDPMATGLLLVGVGRATRLLRFFGDLAKTYTGTARLGVRTDTLDADGEVIGTARVDATRDDVVRVFASMLGTSSQRPPAYSAVKVGGRKLYEAARAGETLEAEPREIRVDAFALTSFDPPDLGFEVVCSGGTYVRVLLADAGDALGPGAHLTSLRRAAIGPYRVEDAVGADDVERPLPVERAVDHLPRVVLELEEARAASNGTILAPAAISGPYGVFGPGGELIGIYEDDGAKARPRVILPR